jgi:hypothetical protein
MHDFILRHKTTILAAVLVFVFASNRFISKKRCGGVVLIKLSFFAFVFAGFYSSHIPIHTTYPHCLAMLQTKSFPL